MQKRFWELDFLRGVAIVMMIVYHTIFDLNFLKIVVIDIYSPAIWFFARAIPVLFITLVGVCLTISHSRASEKLDRKRLRMKFIRRGLWIFSWGIAVTFVSWLLVPEGFIVFGILHFIGLSIILAYPLLRRRGDFFVIGAIFVALGIALLNTSFSFPYLLWLGFAPGWFHTLDFFPILPWFGFILIGIGIGNEFYKDGKRRFVIKELSENKIVKPLSLLGRHALFIYLTHQIAILIIILLLSKFIL
ncbi:MAG: DUF1624 domain-containing protein [Candidatus Aenigmarchaeota archaeon]|nr:DUF1624 domain-containing protein [Candidatus Aenigmarchaeota archaeon]